MNSLRDNIKPEIIEATEDITNDFYVENKNKNPPCFTTEDCCASSSLSKDVEKVIKVEKDDIVDNCNWKSRNENPEIPENNSLILLDQQNKLDNDCNLNQETFVCNICKESFSLESYLKSHIKKHFIKCKFCEKTFKFNFGLKRHIQKNHLQNNSDDLQQMGKCSICNTFIDRTVYYEHMKTHDDTSTKKKTDFVLNLKLCKLNGVWKSKPNLVYKCSVCYEKFDNEDNLVKHLSIHEDDGQTLCGYCLKFISDYELDNHMQQIHSKSVFKCPKCNLNFDKELNLNCHLPHCTKSSRDIWEKFRCRDKSNVKNSFICSVCGVDFDNLLTLTNHKILCCQHHSCNNCNRVFSTTESWLKHDSNTCKDINKIFINERSKQTVVKDNSLHLLKDKPQHTNVTEKNSSDQIDEVNTNESTAHIETNRLDQANALNPYNSALKIRSPGLMKNDNCLNKNQNMYTNVYPTNISDQIDVLNTNDSTIKIKKEKTLCTNINDISEQIEMADTNNSIVQITPCNQIVHNCSLNLKNEKNLHINTTENNTIDQMVAINKNESIKQIISQNSIINNHNLKIKKEKPVLINTTEKNDLNKVNVTTNHESIVQNVANNIKTKQEPTDLDNDNINMHTVRETLHFSIKKIPFHTKSSFVSGLNSKQTSQSHYIFLCNICKKSPSSDLHSFALHMSDHRECTMHECIVCNEIFETVLLWKNHMSYHQQQIDLNLSKSQNNSSITESNQLHIANSESLKPQKSYTIRRSKEKKISSKLDGVFVESCADLNTNLNNDRIILKKYCCKICKIMFPSKSVLMSHQTLHNNLKLFSCKYCDKKFSARGPCTNHEKSHTNKKKSVHNIEEKKLKTVNMQHNRELKNNDIESDSIQSEKKEIRRIFFSAKSYSCEFCKKKFTKQCYLTNHIKLYHKVNPKSVDKLPKLSSEISVKSFYSAQINELPKELKINSHDIVDANLNNFGNKLAFCTICNKQFAHIGALTSHMHTHSNLKPYKCQYCDRKFNMKGPYISHIKTHTNKNKTQNLNITNINTTNIKTKGKNSNDNHNNTNLEKKMRTWFSCDICEKKFSTPFQLIIHRKIQCDFEPYTCTICNKSYSLRYIWNRHIKCHYIRNKFKNSKNNQQIKKPILEIHNLKNTSVQSQNQFKCAYCKKEYNLISQWKKHLSLSKECRRHCKFNRPEFISIPAKKNYKKSLRFECNICKKTYSTTYNQKVHMINVHKQSNVTDLKTNTVVKTNVLQLETVQQKPIISNQILKSQVSNNIDTLCKLCGKTYSNKANLSRHQAIIHSKNNTTISCSECDRTFKHKYTYREHLRVKHNKLLINNKVVGNTNNNLTQQIVSLDKIDLTKYLCKICKMNFSDNISLQKHLKTHSILKYKCNDCGLQFETNVTLGEHILKSHNAKNALIKNNYVENSAIQTNSPQPGNDKSTECKICFKVLYSASYLSKHMRVHSGDKPFKCDECNSSFRFQTNLKMHKKRIHND